MAEKRVAGTCYVKANGEQFDLGGSCTVSPSSVEREGIAGLSGPVGYKETPRIPFVEIEATYSAELDLQKIDKLVDATVTVELANGHVYVLRNAWTKGALEVDAAEGKVTIRFEGLTCERIK